MPLKQTKQLILLYTLVTIMLAGCNANIKPQQESSKSQQESACDTTGYDNSVSKVAPNPNVKDGLTIIRYKDGLVRARGYYVGGLKDVEWQSFYENGKLWSDEYFSKGLLDGKVSVFYSNNQAMYSGQYKRGQPFGTWTYWSDKGVVLRKVDYSKKTSNTATAL